MVGGETLIVAVPPLRIIVRSLVLGTPPFQLAGLFQSPVPEIQSSTADAVPSKPSVRARIMIADLMFPRRDPARFADLSVVIVVMDYLLLDGELAFSFTKAQAIPWNKPPRLSIGMLQNAITP